MKVLLLGQYDEVFIGELESYFEVLCINSFDISNVPRLDFIPNIIVYRSPFVIDRGIIEIMPFNSLVIRAGSGEEGVDLKYLKSKGVEFVKTGTNEKSVVELGLALVICSLRKIPDLNEKVKNGCWNKSEALGLQIAGRTVFIIGFGSIGQEFANFFNFWGCRVISYDRSESSKKDIARKLNVQFCTVENALSEADVILLTLSLNKDTKDFVDSNFLKMCKRSPIIVNVSRGEVVDELALVKSLSNKEISFYATDVLRNEPNINCDLAQRNDCLVTPHIGSQTKESKRIIGKRAMEIIKRKYKLYA